jgi:CRISPR-associated protein Cmr6
MAMSKAAVPDYVAKHGFDHAAPGHRFNLFFEAWRDDWSLDKAGKTAAIKKACPVPKPIAGLQRGVLDRQLSLAEQLPESIRYIRQAKSTAPFAIGLGLEHPVENGFSFLSPYGLPYLAGTGVKGVLRRAAEEMILYGNAPDAGLTWLDLWWLFGFEGAAGAIWPLSPKEQQGLSGLERETRDAWRQAYRDQFAVMAARPDLPEFIRRILGEKPAAHYLDNPRLFLEDLDDKRRDLQLRGALSFWDVFPACEKLTVEIMTPHYSDYYQGKSTPHDAGQPNPIPFLAVPAGAGFTFIVAYEPAFLPEQLRATWKPLLTAIFDHAFEWLGFGAKTAVGYGAMEPDREAEARQARERAENEERRARETRRATMTESLIKVEDFIAACSKQFQTGRQDRQNTGIHQRAQQLAKEARESGGWSGDEKKALAEAISEWLPKVVERIDKDALKKLKLSELRNLP